ncbi:MAG TPA: FAD-dependent oxidoreductase [Nitrososphaerales archaeon]|nr:FAD-dependent oxidoreductase [Nitrososphaerales archaeon]
MMPYWLVGKKSSFPVLKRDVRVDVAVIGAGITGASVCYWLSDKCNVVLLEKETVASQASGRNAGFILTGTSDYYIRAIERYGHEKARTIWKITQLNHDLLENHIFSDDDCDHIRSGSYLVATSDKEMQDLHESVNLLKKDGFGYKLMSEGEIKAVLSSKSFRGAAYNAKDGEVNPVKLVDAMTRKAKNSGIRIFEKTRVRRIAPQKDGFKIVTDHATVNSDFVVLATNAYTPMLHTYLKDKIVPVRGQMLATNPLGKRFKGVFYANYGYEYWRQAPDGRMLVGGFRGLDFAREKGYRLGTTKKIQKSLEKLLVRMSPKFKVEYRWSGIMGFTKDHLPLIGSIPGAGNLLVSAGYSGHGLGFGFIAGKMISEIIIDGKGYHKLFSPSRYYNETTRD